MLIEELVIEEGGGVSYFFGFSLIVLIQEE
jgi:hypothetical protein